MEVKNPLKTVLCNQEVMEILKSIPTKKKYGLRNLNTITYETLQFLEESNCKTQTRESIIEFLNEVRSFQLTAQECLMLVNNPPNCALHIQLLVEDSEERLTEQQVAEILKIVEKHFPQTQTDTSV